MKTEKRMIGDIGEDIATKYLINNKYKILDRNFSASCGEIDIIALETKKSRRIQSDNLFIPKNLLNEDVICFIEVKTRKGSDFGLPADAVNSIKQRKLIKTANLYLSKFKLESKQYRFDIIEVLEGNVNHIKNAF